MKRTILQMMAMTIMILRLGSQAYADPIVDGVYSPSDGYTTGYNETFTLQGTTHTYQGQLWLYQDPTTHNVYIALIQPESLVDNTYGTNAIGWGMGGHKFSDLTGSDMAEFQLKNSSGVVVLDVDVDYLTASSSAPSGYNTLGVTGGDGKVITGSASDVLAVGTSLAYNLNTLGCSSFTTNSPATNSSYAPNASCPNWQFADEYEIEVSGSLFGPTGAYSLNIPLVHDSPSKDTAGIKFTGTPGTPISSVPAPTSFILLGFGLAELALWGRKRFNGLKA